jgi:hypothetical protein
MTKLSLFYAAGLALGLVEIGKPADVSRSDAPSLLRTREHRHCAHACPLICQLSGKLRTPRPAH